MQFATYTSVMAAWGLVGTVCSAAMYLRAMLRTRRMAPAAAGRRT